MRSTGRWKISGSSRGRRDISGAPAGAGESAHRPRRAIGAVLWHGSGTYGWRGERSKAQLTAAAGGSKSSRLLTLSPHPLEGCVSDSLSRRRFLGAAGAVAAAAAIPDAARAAPTLLIRRAGRPAAVSSGNGVRAVDRAMTLMAQGTDTLDAAVEGV